MPTVSFDKAELLSLIGKEMSDEELEYELAMFGAVPDEVGDEVVIDITPNRPDLLSVEGLARGMRYFLGLESRIRVPVVNSSSYRAEVDPKSFEVRPFVVGAVVKGLEMSDALVKSLMQIQEKLHITHSRNRRVAAIGMHDLDKIKWPIKYKVVDDTYSFVPLGFDEEMTIKEIKEKHPKGKAYAHLVPGPKYVVWEDAEGKTLAWPPIINGKATAVTEDTKNLFIDVTGTRLQPVTQALNILVYMLADRGGQIYTVNVDGVDYPDLSPQDMELDPNYTNKLLGLNLSPGEQASLLQRMGHGAKAIEDKVLVKIPAYRTDILHPMDLVEDIAIAYRYDKFEPEIPNIYTVGGVNEETKVSRILGNIIVGFGFNEVLPYHLSSEDIMRTKVGRTGDLVRVKGSVNQNYNVVRDSILPQLLEILSRNKHHEYPQRIFSIGRVFKPDESLVLSAVFSDKVASYSEAKSIVESVMKSIEKDVEIKEHSDPIFLEGRSAGIFLDGRRIGILGEVSPKVLEAFGLEMPVAGFEIDLGFTGWKDW